MGAAFVLYLAVVRHVRAQPSRPSDRWLLIGLLVAALIFRLTLLGLTPTLSDDLYRYLWDGRVQLAGVNPYRFAPNDPALIGLRDGAWRSINHPDIATIYPPLMQGMFRLGAWLSPTLLTQKLLFVACDVLVLLALARLLPAFGVSPWLSVIYAWHPLVVVEVAGSGHNDPLGVLWLLIGLGLWQARRRLASTAAFALAFLSKLASVILVPFYLVRARSQLLVVAAIVAVGGLSCLCSPHWTPGLGHYSRSWEFNSSVYGVLHYWIGQPLAARLLCLGIFTAIGGWLAIRTEDLLTYTVRMIQAAILLTPVLEPWYLLWLIPLLCVRFSWAWLVFSGQVLWSYMVLVQFVHHGLWQLPAWVKWIEYAPLYVYLAAAGLERIMRRSVVPVEPVAPVSQLTGQKFIGLNWLNRRNWPNGLNWFHR